jgi:hypothetical protein
MKKILENILISILSLIISLFPTLIIIALWIILNPVNFWQGLALIGIGAYFLAGIQIILLVFFIMFLVAIWSKD